MPFFLLAAASGLGLGAYFGAQLDDRLDPVSPPVVNNLSLTTVLLYGALGFAAYKTLHHFMKG